MLLCQSMSIETFQTEREEFKNQTTKQQQQRKITSKNCETISKVGIDEGEDRTEQKK